MSGSEIYNAEISEDWMLAEGRRPSGKFFKNTTVATILALIFVSSTTLYFFLDEEAIDYGTSMTFDQERTRSYAQDLVDLGHPEWKGRMSGSAEEQATAEYIADLFEELGYQATLHTYEVPMHSIDSEPSLRVCQPGSVGNTGIAPCSPADFGQQITTFNHRIDYVIQGFSGRSSIMFGDDIEVVHLGDGNDESLWESAAGKVGYVEGGGTKTGNTFYMTSAIEHELSAIIRVNKDNNCGNIEGNDCVPIFKGTNFDAISQANGGNGAPPNLAFIAMSKDAGEIFESVVINSSGRLEMLMDVTNDQELTIRVPCGTYYGKSDELVIVGGHHDTVYHGPGAVDNGAGTASVLEMASMFSEYISKNEIPERTLRFCTWGGEEEGLWGSRAYVAEMNSELSTNLRLYINLDMNHVDIDLERGNSIRLFTNHPTDYKHIKSISSEYLDNNPKMASKYSISVSLLDGALGDDDGMPCNSDHCPFVYDLEGKTGRAAVCYGSGSLEYHTYLDEMTRFNEESLGMSITIYSNYMKFLGWSNN